jgi:hypothetical protein
MEGCCEYGYESSGFIERGYSRIEERLVKDSEAYSSVAIQIQTALSEELME